MRVHRKALSLQGKRASLLVEAILMSGSMLMWGGSLFQLLWVMHGIRAKQSNV